MTNVRQVNCGNTLGCVGGTYDKSASSSYVSDLPGRLDWSYGSGSSGNGDYIREDIHIGGATAKGVRIGLTTNTTGYVGCGPPTCQDLRN